MKELKPSRSLRTLKDIEVYQWDESIPTEKCVVINDLRKEAINWVKEKRRLGKEGLIDNRLTFMNFHNITEEDLK